MSPGGGRDQKRQVFLRQWEEMNTGLFNCDDNYEKRCFNQKPRSGTQTEKAFFH